MMGKLAREALAFNRQLLDSKAATDYLIGRGIGLGVAVAHGLGWDEEGHRVTFPYFDLHGDVVGWKGRFIGDEDPDRRVPKYYAAPGGEIAALWPVPADEVNGPVVLCEGEFDALALISRGFNAVSVPGASSWDKVRPVVLDRYRRSGHARLVIAADADAAGDRLRDEVLASCDTLGIETVTIRPGEGRDVTDELLADSEWVGRLREATGVIDAPPF